LLDTGVIGFANHADLWEPLDDFLERMGFDRELIPQIVDAGRIDGVSCGVITNFYVYTMVTMSDVPKELDYEAFLDFLDDGRYEKKAILNNVNGMDGLSFATIFFHDLDETFLYDASNCKTNFYGEGFHRVLRLARIYDRKENWPTSEDLETGESPCAVIAIQKPEDLAYFRIWGEEKLRFIGFPTQDGSLHYIAGDDQICVRKNAGEKEKRLAYTFLGYLLSPEIQRQLAIDENDPMFHLSVRWDVLDEQMAQVNGDAYPYINGFPQFHLGDDVDVQANLSTMKELLSNAKPYRGAPKELGSILREELSGYLNGDLSEENLKEHLTRRVELYLQERK
ncbi:MAG: extracellular solute-binding protein, partial [Lachnospiraceae bacterium]|nr:extracellular solute-binding protein [Lachnospiraceae bacterium]